MGYTIDTVWPSTMMGFVKNYLIKFKEEITVIDFLQKDLKMEMKYF